MVTEIAPTGYPTMGFYCSLHKYQEPRVGFDGATKFESPMIEEHIRRHTSFVAPEASVASEMLKAPGLVRDHRSDLPRCATGADLAAWLRDRRSLDDTAAVTYAQRMLDLGILQPVGGKASPVFAADRAAFYRIQLTAAGGGGAGGGGAAGGAGARY